MVAGALAAHAADPAGQHRLEVAVRYQMWHALALLGVAWLATTAARCWANAAGAAFAVGTLLFCGSLYLSVASGSEAVTMAAPFGGTAFIVGWFLLAVAGLRLKG